MEIRPSDLLKPTSKYIRPYESNLIAASGPNTEALFRLCGLNIPYDSVNAGVMTLRPGDKDVPIMYGFLGTDITFLAIKASYRGTSESESDNTCYGNSSNSVQENYCCYQCPSDELYLEYYFEDEPLVKKTFTSIFMTSGNDAHRIPQIYLYNPTENIVDLEIMIANVNENKISAKLKNEYLTFNGLYFSSVQSDQDTYLPDYTGSTQFEIKSAENDLLLSLTYQQVEVIERDGSCLLLKTDSDQDIKLEFLSEYNTRQAHSRMMWVMEDYAKRYLTNSYPSVDNAAPIFDWYANPQTTFTGDTITKAQLIENFIRTIVDNRDGEINRYDSEVLIQKEGSIRQFEEITEMGNYNINFSIADIAGNIATDTQNITVYRSAPSIIFNETTDTMYINDSFYYKLEYDENIINEQDIRNYYIYAVEDYVDIIANTAVTILIEETSSGSTSGLTSSGITLVANYKVTFSVSNGAGLTDTEVKILKIRTNANIEPWVLWNPGYEDDDFSVITGLTEAQFRSLTICGLTNTEYDNTITEDDIVLVGDLVFPTTVISSPYTVTYSITNYSGIENTNQPYHTKTVEVVPILASFPEFHYYDWTGLTNLMNTTAITEAWLIEFYVSAVTDLVDGNVPISNVTLEIRNSANQTISEITMDGDYKLIFRVENSQMNETTELKTLTVDSQFDGGNAFGPFDFTIWGGNASQP